jgi:PadR family transcriptional regulator, regulatory protein PadR
MEPLQRVTAPTLEVLQVLLDAGEPLWGLRIMDALGRPSGTVYPILERLERQGWIRSEWAAGDAGPHGERQRRLYELTPEGAPAARELLRARAESPPASRPSRAKPAG